MEYVVLGDHPLNLKTTLGQNAMAFTQLRACRPGAIAECGAGDERNSKNGQIKAETKFCRHIEMISGKGVAIIRL
jgi:hypothetical protein